MADEINALVELGLSPNEAKLYLLLVINGQMKANELAIKSGLQRRTVYDTLASLEKKGLAGKAEVHGVQTFSPSPPSSLLSFVDEKRDAIEKILPALSKPFEAAEKTNVSVLYGNAGFKSVLEDILALQADYCVYYGQLQTFDYLPKFFPLFNERRKQLGVRARYILLDTPQSHERAKLVPLADFKFMDPSTLSLGVWWTYADRLVLFVLQKEIVTIFIKNSELAKTFQRTFDSIFSSGAQVYRGLDGMKAILERTLEFKKTLFIAGTGQIPTRLPDYIAKEYSPRAKKSGHVWYNVAHRSMLNTAAATLPYHKFRFLPKYFEANPAVVWIFGDCVANVVWQKEPVAFLIEDKRVADAYKAYFKLLWKISEKK